MENNYLYAHAIIIYYLFVIFLKITLHVFPQKVMCPHF